MCELDKYKTELTLNDFYKLSSNNVRIEDPNFLKENLKEELYIAGVVEYMLLIEWFSHCLFDE